MEAITKQFILPARPQVIAQAPCIYPWENTNLFNLCQQLYQLAANTGYNGTFDEFKISFGTYLESDGSLIDYDIYTGEYTVTALPEVEQILRTRNKILTHDIVIEPIPQHEVDNKAGGRTVTIG